jgi:rubrerythrin
MTQQRLEFPSPQEFPSMLTLSAAEVLIVGVDLERRSAAFYAQAARQTEDASCKSLLFALGRMEESHEQRLQSWLAQVSPDEKVLSPERIAEAKVTLSTLALGPFLSFKTDPNARLTGDESTEELLEKAIGFEDNAIVLLTALMDLMSPEMGRQQAEAVRAEEYKHRQVLQEQLVVHRVRNQLRACCSV